MGKFLPRLLAGMALSVVLSACARVPMQNPQGAAPNPLPAPSPQGGGVSPGPVDRTGAAPRATAPDGTVLGGLTRGGAGDQVGPADVRFEPTTRVPGLPAPDLGQRISNYVGGLDVINGGINLGGGPVAGGYGGGGGGGGQVGAGRDMSTDMTGAGTSRIGRGLGVSTMIVGNRAFIGIDPATMGVGSMGGAPTRTGVSLSGDPRGAAGPGLEGYLRDRIRSQFPQVSEVFVTTDPAMVSRIARVTTAGYAGNDSDIVLIARALAPMSSNAR